MDEISVPISKNNIAIEKDENKCIKCGYCVSACKNKVTVGKMYDISVTKEPICINCGQCTNMCPTEAITEKNDYKEVNKYLQNNEKTVVFSVAPAVRSALGEEFGLKPGINVDKKIVSALKLLGAKYVFDVTFSADLTIMEEAMELVNRIKENKNLPMFTSCCPAWVKYAEIFYPELLPNISTCKSPIAMQGTIIKTYFAKKIGVDASNIINVAVAPCTAKKYEVKREEVNVSNGYDTDFSITTRELAKMIREADINIEELEETDFDSPLGTGTGAATIFGNTGGVTEAAIRTAYYYITGKDLEEDKIVFSKIRGMSDIKEANIEIDGKIIKVAVANGMNNAKILIDKILNKEVEYHFVEVMNCNGGCIAGGGQPKITLLNMEKTKLARINCLYEEDEKSIKRVSYKNPEIIQIYKELYGKPNSELAHKHLHTIYKDKSGLLRGEEFEN